MEIFNKDHSDKENEQINKVASQMANDLVNHLNKVLPSSAKLDFSEESLKVIDVLIEQLRKEGNDEKAAENEIMAFGAYIGEIIKLNYGGKWTTPELAGFPKDGATYSVVFQLTNGAGINPLGRVLKYFRHGSKYSVNIFYDLVKMQMTTI